jgi:hypothetical protein
MVGARYHVALVGEGMVSKLIISPVSLGFTVTLAFHSGEIASENATMSRVRAKAWVSVARA